MASWANNKVCLLTAEVIRTPTQNHNNNLVTFVMSDEASRQKMRSITLDYSEEKCVKLSAANTAGSWVTRAIEKKRTPLKDNELSEFLQIVADSTFAFLRIGTDAAAHVYLMALAKDDGSKNVMRMELVAAKAPLMPVEVATRTTKPKEQGQPEYPTAEARMPANVFTPVSTLS
jgi:hypothetical protein